MKSICKSFVASSLFLLPAAVLHAQILWSAATNITGPGDISTLGTFVAGVTASNSQMDQTVGDTVFHYGAFNGPISTGGPGGDDGSASPDTTSPGAASYNLALEGCFYVGAGQVGSFTLGTASNPLILGDTYQVQIWNSTHFNGRDTVFTDGTSVVLDSNSAGQYTIGTFTATALTPTQTITFQTLYPAFVDGSSAPGDNYAEFNAVSLRDLGAVPETSTWALVLGGMAVLAFGMRRQFQSTRL